MTGHEAIRVLTFTTLYPNSIQKHHGVFVENRLRHLVASVQAARKIGSRTNAKPNRSHGEVFKAARAELLLLGCTPPPGASSFELSGSAGGPSPVREKPQ